MHNEQVFTPSNIVNVILDKVDYVGSNIRKKYIIDNSCGNGNFLVEIIDRYIKQCWKEDVDDLTINFEITEYIQGIEIDEKLAEETRERCLNVLKENDLYIDGVSFIKIYNADTLYAWQDFEGKMDFVVGNPPYCKVHHLDETQRNTLKNMEFSKNGMTDLYIAFFEMGINMLKENGGVLGYITPSSWFTSIAGKELRRKCYAEGLLTKMVLCGHEQIFEDATTFAAITVLEKSDLGNSLVKVYDISDVDDFYRVRPKYIYINDNFYFISDKSYKKVFKRICEYDRKKYFKVKNGFATLNDKMFVIKDKSIFDNTVGDNVIPVIKASTGEKHRIIFPYDENGKSVEFQKLPNCVQNHMLAYAQENNIDINKEGWHLYGRTQAINDVKYRRCCVNNIIKDISDIKIDFVLKNEGVYSGFYVLPEEDSYFYYIEKILKTEDFLNYIKTLGKYKNGGYYTFSSKELENYLNYTLSNILGEYEKDDFEEDFENF